LAQRKHGKQQTDDERRGAERFRVKRQQRHDDPEANQVDEDREEDDEQRPRHRRGKHSTITGTMKGRTRRPPSLSACATAGYTSGVGPQRKSRRRRWAICPARTTRSRSSAWAAAR